MIIWIYFTLFFLCPDFVPLGFTGKIFNEAVVVIQKNTVLFFLQGFFYRVFPNKVLMRYILIII